MNRVIGIILVGISAASFGTFAILGRYAYADGLDAPTILFLRFSLATPPSEDLLYETFRYLLAHLPAR